MTMDEYAQALDRSAAIGQEIFGRNAARNAQIERACSQACQAIAPTWPLERSIAVNPHWQRIGLPLRKVAARMAVLGDVQVFPARSQQLLAWSEGRITVADLVQALAALPATQVAGLTVSGCIEALNRPPQLPHLPLLIDVLDNDPRRHTRLSWRSAITHQVSQTCAAYFDEHQAQWQPPRADGLYAFWRDTLQHDHGIGLLMGLPDLGRGMDALPATRQDAERWVLHRFGLPESVWADYLEAVLLTVNGWASWCAYLGWQARLEGRDDPCLRDLLAIRLAWGAILLDSKDDAAANQAFALLRNSWDTASVVLKQAEEALLIDEVWQVALEMGYQRQLALRLLDASAELEAPVPVEVQAAFCIDVRSEPMRRAIEAVWPAVQTIGFAGFFGVPAAYTPLATTARRPQLPGLLAPAMEITDQIVRAGANPSTGEAAALDAVRRARTSRFGLADQWLSASQWPSAAFSFVESAGFGYLGTLRRWLSPGANARVNDDLAGLPARYRHVCRPQLAGLTREAKVALAASVLRAMGLHNSFAALILLVGHGSQTHNNAHAAALDCGACCGQTGEVNARSLALLLNEASVRAGLREMGVTVPDSSWFVAALHNTTTDEIDGFDLDLLPATALAQWEALQPKLAQASNKVRRERATMLGLDANVTDQDLLRALRQRANDGAQTRPEWGLAGNASFVIAPRDRTRGVDLGGRSFLHDYEAGKDPEASVLELLMTAPMLVTHWINWQYHASTCDPVHLGSGNKVLHNVVGGHLGVFEGNGGDLRIGLSRQSLHDGTRWMHEPIRLTVVIDAPSQSIERIILKHPVLQQLLNNAWLHLWRYDGSNLVRYDHGHWYPLAPTGD